MTTPKRIPAVFMRGGTSKALMFHRSQLPQEQAKWDSIFIGAMGSPDPQGRQLNGMGGGLSSLSKVCIVGPPSSPDADVDYTFGQVQITKAAVDYSGNCGNMSSAIGPFALDEALIQASGSETTVRIHNTNTRKIILSTFAVENGRSAYEGSMQIPGVAGAGAPIKLEFVDPGGATTGSLLPTGQLMDTLDLGDLGSAEVSMIDAANACVFIAAQRLGLTGAERPDQIAANHDVLRILARVRECASIRMGIAASVEEARAKPLVPFVVMVAPANAATMPDGHVLAADDADVTVRAMSNGQPHRALPLTVSLCAAVAASIEGTVVHRESSYSGDGPLRLAMPSGVLHVGAKVSRDGNRWTAERGVFYRTARRLFEGYVYY